MGVEVGSGEHLLLQDEDLVPYPMMDGRLVGAADRPAEDLRSRHQQASTCTGMSRRSGFASRRSMAPSAEHA